MEDELLTPDEVSEMTKGTVTKAALAQRRYMGLPPAWLAPTPRRVLYRRSAVEAWINGSERTSTAERVSA